METFNANEFAAASAAAAIDQQDAFGGLAESVGSHFDNLRDTMAEHNVTGQYAVADAEEIYWAAVKAAGFTK